MGRSLICKLGCILILLLLPAATTQSDGGPGPLHVPNRFPLFWMFLAPGAIPVGLPEDGSLETSLAVDYSALYFNHSNARWRWLMDMETTVISLSAAYRLAPRCAIGLNLPFISMNSGFLDVFLEGYHNALGVPNYGREERPANEFAFEVDKNDQVWIRGQSGRFQPADATFFYHYQWRSAAAGGGFSSLLTLALQLPTGDARQGCGNGGLDAGIYLPMQWEGKRWSYYMTSGLTWIGSGGTSAAEVAVRHTANWSGGVSFKRNERWYWLAQLDYHTSPLEHTGIGALDDGSLQLSFGTRYRSLQGWALELAFSEDLSGAVPDFTVHLELEWII